MCCGGGLVRFTDTTRACHNGLGWTLLESSGVRAVVGPVLPVPCGKRVGLAPRTLIRNQWPRWGGGMMSPFGGLYGPRPLNLTRRHGYFLNSTGGHGHFLNSTCDIEL